MSPLGHLYQDRSPTSFWMVFDLLVIWSVSKSCILRKTQFLHSLKSPKYDYYLHWQLLCMTKVCLHESSRQMLEVLSRLSLNHSHTWQVVFPLCVSYICLYLGNTLVRRDLKYHSTHCNSGGSIYLWTFNELFTDFIDKNFSLVNITLGQNLFINVFKRTLRGLVLHFSSLVLKFYILQLKLQKWTLIILCWFMWYIRVIECHSLGDDNFSSFL